MDGRRMDGESLHELLGCENSNALRRWTFKRACDHLHHNYMIVGV